MNLSMRWFDILLQRKVPFPNLCKKTTLYNVIERIDGFKLLLLKIHP